MSFAGNPDSAATAGFCPAPPPPPPPPPVPGQTPALRISTAEAPRPRRGQNNLSSTTDPYEPPAAIQNAMMTKDKKPFTYTPGMGGKLDLSQIRSPRMARRVAKNANDEGIEGPPKSALEQKTGPTSTAGGNLYVQPQVAVPVFPTNINPQPNVNRTTNANLNRAPSNAWSSQPEPRRVEQKISQVSVTPVVVPSSPQSPTTPPQVTLAKAPTPWLQNKPKPQEELPEWAKRANAPRSVDLPVESPTSPTSPVQHQTQQFYVQANTPPPASQPQVVQRQPSVQKVVSAQPRQQQDRVVPVRVEDRPSVFSVKNEPGHHQFKQPPNQQQRWGQQQQQQQQQSGGTRIIPIMVEDESQPQPQSQIRTIPVEVAQGPKVIIQRGPPGPPSPVEPGPVQSRSFRVLQKITDTDSDTDVDGNSEQIRKLQLTEDDKTLMNKFKEQVDGETYLHQEEDPRYRGAAIPSRAFRFLQNMTESGEVPSTSNAGPRPASAINKKQNRNSKSFEDAQAGLPPSEQQVQEPKKYMGSAIPSRSFRILQAMTSPENIAPQENRQQDFTSRTENSQTGNQQSGLFYPNCPPSPYWSPEGGWWGYYPYQYAVPPPPSPQNTPTTPTTPQGMNLAYNPYAYCGYAAAEGNPYAYYHHQPIYDQNYAQSWAQSFQAQNQLQANGEAEVEGEGEGEGRQTPSQSQIQSQSQSQSQTQCHQIDPTSYFTNGYEPSLHFNKSDKNQEPKITRESKKENGNCVPKKEVDYLTVPRWGKNNRASSANSEVKKNLDIDTKRKLENDYSVNGAGAKTDIEPEDSESNSDSDSDSSDSESSEDSTDSSSSSSSSNSDTESESEYVAYTNEVVSDKNNEEKSLIEEPVKSNSEKDCLKSLSATTLSEDGLEHSSRLSSEKISCSDCDSDADDEYQIESLNNDCILPHQLSVIYEDIEQTETESESRKLDCLEEGDDHDDELFDETGDPPDDDDDGDDTTVSVSLPLRFKFSVSENDEDVTTVIVGDSTVKPGSKLQESGEKLTSKCDRSSSNDEENDVHVNFRIKNTDNTSVDFTLKRQKDSPPNESFDTEFTLTTDEARFELRESFEENFNVEGKIEGEDKANEGLAKKIDCNDNIETEFTIRRKKTDVTRHVWRKELDLDVENDVVETLVKNEEPKEDTETEYTVRSFPDKADHETEYEVTTSTSAIEDNVHREIVEKKSLIVAESESVQTEFSVRKLQRNSESDEKNDRTECPLLMGNCSPPNKRLLCVQNSKDETDDEDSGVTSDMSRIISEADTDDSESASIRRMNKYQRTQTHSRLFKLLNDDAVLAEEDSSEEFYSPGRREHLCLPLKSTVFNYDENYYSNYSSGITSPDYSPLCEQSWKRIHEGRSLESDSSAVTTPNESIDLGDALNYGVFQTADKTAPNDDPYFQNWKKVASPVQFDPTYDILPSIAFKKLKKLENNRGNGNGGGGGVNYHPRILCPRIKSSKNIPQTLQSMRKSTPSSIPFLATISSLKNGHC